jgi:hypothetical protein
VGAEGFAPKPSNDFLLIPRSSRDAEAEMTAGSATELLLVFIRFEIADPVRMLI